ASIELDGRPTGAETSLGAAGRSACATSTAQGFHGVLWAGRAHGYKHECPRHIAPEDRRVFRNFCGPARPIRTGRSAGAMRIAD
ncbi:MAG TPA: hypothetical protein VMH81_03175, partial [Bryobacteraceae bacterium]|nr:hypothetical protein [Bryobacteraceae bacterium]